MVLRFKPDSFGVAGRRDPSRGDLDRRSRIGKRARYRPTIEGLERRIALSTITWNVARAPTGGDWDSGSNWVGGVVPGPSDTAVLPRFNQPAFVFLNRKQADSVGGVTTDPSVTLAVQTGSLSIAAASSSTFGGSVTIASGASMSFGDGASLAVGAGQSLNVNGALTFGNGDQVSFLGNGQSLTKIAVNGTLTATSSSFTSGNGPSSIAVGVTGRLIASNCTFSLTRVVLTTDFLGSGDLVGNAFIDGTAFYVQGRWLKYLGQNTSFCDIDILDAILQSGTLALGPIGADTSNLRYVFPAGYTIGPRATVSVAPGLTVVIPSGQALSVGGTLSLGNGDTVLLDPEGQGPAQIAVGGTLSATGTSFSGSDGDGSSIQINPGASLNAVDCIFALSLISLSRGAGVTLLAAQVGDSSTTTQLAIGGGMSVDLGGITITSGATVEVGHDATVVVHANQTLTVDGTLDLAPGASVSLDPEDQGPAQVVVAGTLTAASGTSFTSTGGDGSSIQVVAGGDLKASNSQFTLGAVTLGPGSGATMTGDKFGGSTTTTQLVIDSGATIAISRNDFSGVGADGVVATGDPGAQILLAHNYWGTTDTATIAGMILDHATDPTRPTVVYQPIVNGTTAISVTPTSTDYSSSDQTVVLLATVTSSTGLTVGEGTERFSIWSGTQLIGLYTNWVTVSKGTAFALLTLPANTPAGSYSILAEYSGSDNYLATSDATQTLTVNPAATSATSSPVTATFSSVADQKLSLTATIASGAGTVAEGTVTFTVQSGGNPVGTPVLVKVAAGVATASYTLPAGTPGGSYTVQADYSDPSGNFLGTTGSASLTVAAAATTAVGSDQQTIYNASAGEPIVLGANVSSPAGTINEGTITFTILDGRTQVMAPVVLAVTGGVASGTALLPAGTAAKTYDLQAVYNGTTNYAPSLQVDNVLTVSSATTMTIAADQAASFSAADQALSLTAGVACKGQDVGEGIVTFTVQNGTTTIGIASAPVVAGQAVASFTLPPGTTVGAYQVHASYSDASTGNYVVSSGDAVLTVTKATPAIAWANPADIAYGTPLTAAQLDATALVPGTFAYSPAAGTVLAAGGNQTLSVSFTPADTVDYLPATATASINVTQAVPKITWADPADIAYGTPLTAAQLDATASVPGSFAYAPAAGTVLATGGNQALVATFTPADAADYAMVTAVAHINVTRALPTFSGLSLSQTIAYGTSSIGVSGVLAGPAIIPAGETVTITIGTLTSSATIQAGGSFSATIDTHALTASATAYPILYTFTGDSYYLPASDASTTLTVSKTVPVLTWADPADIVYGTPLSAAQLDATASVPGTFAYAPAVGTVPATGNNQALVATFTPADTTDYATVSATSSINVLRAVPKFAGLAASQSVTYGQSAVFVSGVLAAGTAIPRGGSVTVAIGGATATALVLSDGSFAATVDVHGLGASLSPYLVSYSYAGASNFDPALDASTTLTVGKATPVIAWADPADIVYGTPLSAAQLDASASVPGTFAYAPAVGTVPAAGGNQPLVATFIPADLTDYATVATTAHINVAAVVPQFAGLTASQSVTYGRPGVLVSGMLAAGMAVPRGGSVTIAIGGATATAAVQADGSFAATVYVHALAASPTPYTIHYSYSGDAGFDPALDASTTLRVDPAVLTVSAAGASVGYGSPIPALTYSISGLANGDTVGILTGALATSARPASAPGSYLISQGTLSAGPNYDIAYRPAYLTIVPPEVAVLGVSVTRRRFRGVAAITLTLNGELDESSVKSLSNYRLTRANRRGSFAGRGSQAIGLKSVSYSWNGSVATVVLTPRRPFGTYRPVRLVTTGLIDHFGTAIAGNHGSSDVRVLSNRTSQTKPVVVVRH
jgi:hypothetical protein